MITATFERLFGRLVGAFKQHEDVPRVPDNVRNLGAARWELELARAAIAQERERMADQAAARADLPRPRQAAVSDRDLARLRAFGAGYISG